ncbi:MAG: DUF3887 domain-containing protein [Oscillospiraceae bacterium]
MKKLLSAVLALSLVFALSACAAKADLGSFDEAGITKRAEEVIDIVNTGDYDAVVLQVREDLRPQLTAKQLSDAWAPALTTAGKFVEFSASKATSAKDEASGEEYATVQVVCKYENGPKTFTISMDKDMAITGLYMK